MPMKQYYQMALNPDATEADIDIYGDICEWAWEELGEMDAVMLSNKLAEMPSTVQTVNVHINSYGGSVKEGLAIYNALRRHQARIVTTCDGMACSIASVIFMAGDERIMGDASLLMIHNAWTYTAGNANELRKQADDLDTITSASVAAYMSRVNIDEDELRQLMDAETWILPSEALDMGFATAVTEDASANYSQSARKSILQAVRPAAKQEAAEPVQEPAEPEPTEPSDDGQAIVDDTEPAEGEDNGAEQRHSIDWAAIAQAINGAQ